MSIFDLFKRKKDVIDDSEFSVDDRGTEVKVKYGDVTFSKICKGSIYTHDYWDYFLPTAYLFESPKVLLIGLGGGIMAIQLRALFGKKLDLEAVEISRRAIEISKEFVKDGAMRIILADGAEYVRERKGKYDVIMLDAYIFTSIPKQFLSMSFVNDAYEALAPDGVLAVNYAVGMMGQLRLNRYVSRLKTKFKVFRVGSVILEGNLILVCSKTLGREEILSRICEKMRSDEENNEHIFRSYERMKEL
jgi:spermidine synthase